MAKKSKSSRAKPKRKIEIRKIHPAHLGMVAGGSIVIPQPPRPPTPPDPPPPAEPTVPIPPPPPPPAIFFPR